MESVVILETDWMDHYQVNIRRFDNVIKVRINDEKARIGFQYQWSHNYEYNYTFMMNEKEEE